MTTHDPSPSDNSDKNAELEASYRNLYDILSHPFAEGFTSLGYKLTIEAKPNKDAIINLPGGARDKIQEIMGITLDTQNEWRILFSHDEQKHGLVANTVGMRVVPDDSSQPFDMIFKRFQGGVYLPLQSTGEKDGTLKSWMSEAQRLEADVFDTSEIFAIHESLMDKILEEAGFQLDATDNNPETRFAVANVLSKFTNWKRREQIISPLGIDLSLTLTRESVSAKEGTVFDSGGDVTAYVEDFSLEGIRQQLVISMAFDGHLVENPSMRTRKLTPSKNPTTIATYGPNAYDIVEIEEVAPTVEIVDRIAEDLMEDLGDIA